jgi:hypothetical protein
MRRRIKRHVEVRCDRANENGDLVHRQGEARIAEELSPAVAQAATPKRGWLTDGRCVVPASERSFFPYVGPEAELVASRAPCYQAANSAQGMLEKGVQYGPNPFRFTAYGARWRRQWKCTRRRENIKNKGPVYRISCGAGNARMRFTGYP